MIGPPCPFYIRMYSLLAQALSEKGVGFTTRDVTQDEEALAKLERMNAVGTPVTVVDGEEVIFGFDRKKLQETLGL